jgi:hypothetical protein
MKLAAGLGVGGRQIGGKKDFHGGVQKIVDEEIAADVHGPDRKLEAG